jgi:hypothetical protein
MVFLIETLWGTEIIKCKGSQTKNISVKCCFLYKSKNKCFSRFLISSCVWQTIINPKKILVHY